MELKRDTILNNIHGCTPEALDFIDRWFDRSPYITAHTSGSTGQPKEINLLKSDMRVSALSTNRFFNITEKSSLLCPLSAGYIAGKMMIVRAILSGATLWLEQPCNTPVNKDYGQIDLIAVVPSQVPHLLTNRNIIDMLGNILIGGASLSQELAGRIIDSGANAYVSYGMTETCSHVALRKVNNSVDEIYEAMPDIFFSKNSSDCLIVNSLDRSFRELHTNDIVNLIDDRHFIWIGRIDNVINSGGIKVYPEKIEQQLHRFIPDNIEYYIAGCRHDKWGEAPVLVISEDIAQKDKLLDEIRNNVKSKAERPVQIIVSKIEHTSSGKIIRRQFV